MLPLISDQTFIFQSQYEDRDFFWCPQGPKFGPSSGAEIRPLSQWDLGDFFPQFEKNSQSQKKKKKKNFFFRIFIQSPHTHSQAT